MTQSSQRPPPPITPKTPGETPIVRGLKIPVSLVRFRLWAPKLPQNPGSPSRTLQAVRCNSADQQSSNSPDLCRCLGRWGKSRCPAATLIRALEKVRLELRVPSLGDCWIWTAGTSGGYGRLQVDGQPVRAHRVVYELLVGPIAAGLELDHLCEALPCVNPFHVEPVTHAENLRRQTRLRDWMVAS